MNYEQKYKDALERARQEYYTTENVERKQWLEELFPVLKESEDERIRKKLIEFFKDWGKSLSHCWSLSIPDILAWLEKQATKSVNIDIDSMISSYEQRLKSQGGMGNTSLVPLVNMCLTAFRHGVEDVLEELNLKTLEMQGEQKPFDESKEN